MARLTRARRRQTPLNLLDAVRLFGANKGLRAGIGDDLVDSYVELKLGEGKSYATTLSQWERENTLGG